MKGSLAASLTFHAAILVAALVVLPNPKHEVKPVEAIQVDISKIGDVTKKMAMTTEAEAKTEKPAPKKAEKVAKADPKAKVAEEVKKVAKEPKAEPPPPEPKKEEPKKEEPPKKEPPPPDTDAMAALLKKTVEEPPKKKEEPKKEEAKKPEAKPKDKPKPDKKPEKKQEKLDVNQMEAFLNKLDGESTAPVEASQQDGSPTKGEANLQGTDNELAATVVDALKKRIQDCWVVPPGAREANISVRLRIMLNPDGTANGTPQVMNGAADPLFDATARSAIAAVMACQTYDFLPQDRYDLWKDFLLTFNPNMMFDS